MLIFSRWRCNEAWHYVIQLVDKLCNVCFKLKHLFLLSLHLVDNLVKNVDELGSEHHVRTHINEPPCYIYIYIYIYIYLYIYIYIYIYIFVCVYVCVCVWVGGWVCVCVCVCVCKGDNFEVYLSSKNFVFIKLILYLFCIYQAKI